MSTSKVLRKIYKGNNLEFRLHPANPYLYNGFKQNGELFSEIFEGWGWTTATFSADQLEELQDW